MLVSFNLASNRPELFRGLCDNLQKTARNPVDLEVLVKVDTHDDAMRACTLEEQKRRPFAIKTLVTPGEGYFRLWQSLNQLHRELCSPDAYFVCNINDEIRFKTVGWDERLRAYVGFYPDDIFRLKISQFKLNNYIDFWQNGYAPENYAFYTKRWIDVAGGDWNACHGPDAFQQFIAYYLAGALYPAKEQLNRDVPIWDVAITGEGAFLGLTDEQHARRVREGWVAWYVLVSHRMQEDAHWRARCLQAHITARAMGYTEFDIEQRAAERRVVVMDLARSRVLMGRNGKPLSFSYRLSWLRITWTNFFRRPLQGYWCGGGQEVWPIAWKALAAETWRGVVGRIMGTHARHEGLGNLGWMLINWLDGARIRRRAMNNLAIVQPDKETACRNCGLAGVVAQATSQVAGHSSANLTIPRPVPWGSRESNEDTAVWLHHRQAIAPTAVRLVAFAPNGRLHLCDVSVVGRRSSQERWRILPARVSPHGDFRDRVRLRDLDDFDVITLSIDTTALRGQLCSDVGIACFSESLGYSRNNLNEGFGIYLRGLRVDYAKATAPTTFVGRLLASLARRLGKDPAHVPVD